MRKTILTFGLISGAISSLMIVATASVGNRIGFDKGAVIGYTTIVLSFLLVFCDGTGFCTFGRTPASKCV